MKIVRDLGEDKLPEAAAVVEPPPSDTSAVVHENVEKITGTPPSPAAATEEAKAGSERSTTTAVRKPMDIPASVQVTIGSDSLIDYVGPPIYQRERIYTKMGPPGVSCGLGYLGNGAGSVSSNVITIRRAY